MTRQTSTLHFDLSEYSQDIEFRLLCGVEGGIRLKRYVDHPNKLEEHRATNVALGLIAEPDLTSITHFVESVNMPARGLCLHQVVSDSLDDHPLPELHAVYFHIGEVDVARALRMFPDYGAQALHHGSLATYGVSLDDTLAQYADVHRSAAHIKPAGVTAQSLVLHHPEIGTANGAVAKYVLDKYATQGQQYQDLVTYLQTYGPGKPDTWYNKSWAMWSQNPDGTGPLVPAEANLDLEYKGGVKADPSKFHTPPGASAPGLMSYQLTDEYDPPKTSGSGPGVVEAAAPVVQNVLKLTKNDSALNGLLWSKQDGTTEKLSTNTPPSVSAPPSNPIQNEMAVETVESQTTLLATGAGAKAFAVKNVTPSYGIWIYDDDKSFDTDTKRLKLPLKNWPSRYLGAYVEFFEASGNAIKRSDITAKNPLNPGKPFKWDSRLPFEIDLVKAFAEPSDTKNYLTWLSSGSAVLGIPVPPLTSRTNLEFLWPDAATHAKILLGGLGCASGFTDWDSDVDLVGVAGTAIVCYGIGTVTLLAGVYIVNPWIAALEGDDAVAFYAVAGVIGVSAAVIGALEYDTNAGKAILSKLAGIAGSVLFGQVTKRLLVAGAKNAIKKTTEATAETVAEMTAEEALEQVPIAGWALKIVSIAANVSGLAATTIECVLSPATYEIDVLRTMDLTVTVAPDPAHGKKGFKPVWPLVSDHYVIQVKYPSADGQAGGTTYTKAGPMPGQHDDPITVVFEGIPAGGKVEVSGNIYSDTNWLCGRWDSGWINAVPDAQSRLSTSGNIKQFLVPLTATTAYAQKQTIAYSPTAKHHWNVTRFSLESKLTPDFDAGAAPSTAIISAFADNGNAISSTTSTIAVNTAMKSWTLTDTASGAVYDVETHEIFVGEVFTLDIASTKADLDKGGATPASVSTTFSNAKYPLDSGTTVTVVTPGKAWSIGQPGQPSDFVIDASGTVLQTSFELTVHNTAQPAPPLPKVFPLPTSGLTGNQIGALQNIIHNNKEYELGYAWMASGQNLPLDGKGGPSQVPMYSMQSISTLGQPQDQIIEPTMGFSQPTLIAYDQFGLSELFPLDNALVADLVDGPVATPIADEFAAFGRTLPTGAAVVVVTAGTKWQIGVPSEEMLYELRLASEDDKQHIAVFAYPVPSLDNFYLDPRDHTAQNPVYYLRGVDLKQGPGEFEFDYDTSTAWGRIINAGSLQALAVHPHGYVVAVDYLNHKLYTLKLPAEAVSSDEAPIAMPLAGEGVREGLMQNPQALSITADGRILILEEGNKRIQAFDVKGNPVSCFSVGQPCFTIDKSFTADLDSHQVTTALVQQFQLHTTPALAPKFALEDGTTPPQIDLKTAVSDLDAGKVNAEVAAEFHHFGYGAADDTYTVTSTTAGALWLVTNDKSRLVFDVRLQPNHYGIDELSVYLAPTLDITVRSKTVEWLIGDTTNSTRYEVTAQKSGDLEVQQVLSYMPLRESTTTGISYLDIAVEPKGYVYVLMVQQTSGAPTFYLDIYNPDGSVLLDKPQSGVNARRLTIDQWRSMFTLNYNVVLGPNGRTEPGVSQWQPSTPDPAKVTKASRRTGWRVR